MRLFLIFLLVFNIQVSQSVKKCCSSNNQVPSYAELYNITGNHVFNFLKLDCPTESLKETIFINDDYAEDLSYDRISGFPNCSQHYFLSNSVLKWFRFRDGSFELGLRYFADAYWLKIPNSSYCIHEYANVGKDPSSGPLKFGKNTLLIFCDFKEYQQYKSFRKFIGITSIAGAMIMLPILIIYIILWNKQTVANWLTFIFIFGLAAFQFVLGVVTLLNTDIVKQDASFFSFTIYLMLAGYFGLTMILTGLILNSHMLYTFCALIVRIRAPERDFTKLKLYSIFIILGPIFFISCCEITVYSVKRTHPLLQYTKFQYAHHASFPVSFDALQIVFAVLVPLCVIIIGTTGIVVIYLRCILKMKCRQQKESFQESLHLFCRLFLGSGIVVGLSYLAVRLMDLKDLSWALVICERIPFLLTSIYFLFAFGFTTENLILIMKKLKVKSFL